MEGENNWNTYDNLCTYLDGIGNTFSRSPKAKWFQRQLGKKFAYTVQCDTLWYSDTDSDTLYIM